MRAKLWIGFLVLSLLPLSTTAFGQPLADLVEQAKPAIVIVEAPTGLGTGFYLGEGCLVVTAAHVVGVSRSARIHSRTPTYAAPVIGWDRQRDIAVLQGQGPCRGLTLADSDRVRQGEEIFILGYPALVGAQEREPSLTRGVISATRGRSGLFQYDASTVSGSSGSPVFNLRGEVIGVHVAAVSRGFAFAVPSNWVRSLAANPVIVRSRPAFDDRIVPGERISGIALGMTINLALAAAIYSFGGPAASADDCTNQQDREKGASCHIRTWRSPEGSIAAYLMLVGPPGQETVIYIYSTLPKHKTEEGLGVGSLLSDFIRAFGEAEKGDTIRGTHGHPIFIRRGTSGRYPVAYWPQIGTAAFYTEENQRVFGILVLE